MNVPDQLIIERLRTTDEARACAEMMAKSEPWLTLKLDFAHAFELLSDPMKEVYLARLGGALAGHIALNMSGPFAGYIQVLAVAPEWRSRGIGAQLIQFAEQRIFRESPNVFLCVSGFNLRAQEFYACRRQERIGVLKNYVIGGASEFLLRKSIAPKRDFKAGDFNP